MHDELLTATREVWNAGQKVAPSNELSSLLPLLFILGIPSGELRKE